MKENLQQLRRGIVYLQTSEELVTPEYQDDLTQFYLEDFRERYEAESGTRADDAIIDSLLPRILWRSFCRIDTCRSSTSERSPVRDSIWICLFKLEQSLREFQERFGFYDVFLIEPNDGRIVYSVEREIDFGTSLFDGPHSNTNLARAVTTAMAANPDEVIFADFRTIYPFIRRTGSFCSYADL